MCTSSRFARIGLVHRVSTMPYGEPCAAAPDCNVACTAVAYVCPYRRMLVCNMRRARFLSCLDRPTPLPATLLLSQSPTPASHGRHMPVLCTPAGRRNTLRETCASILLALLLDTSQRGRRVVKCVQRRCFARPPPGRRGCHYGWPHASPEGPCPDRGRD